MAFTLIDHLWSLTTALICAVTLWAIYGHIESKWPWSYYSVADYKSYFKASAPFRYLLFRFGPVILTSAFGIRQLASFDKPVWTFGIALWMTHVSSTSGRSLVNARRHGAGPPKGLPGIIHYISALVCLICVLAPIPIRQRLIPIIPELEALVIPLWTALFVIIIGLLFVQATSNRVYSLGIMIAKQYERIGYELIAYAQKKAEASGLNRELVQAVMIAESLQRPTWFRRLEKLKGRVWREGTYGIMQVRSDRPISDRESIDIALERHRDVFAIKQQNTIDQRVAGRLMDYNPSLPYTEMIMEIYHHLTEGEDWRTG